MSRPAILVALNGLSLLLALLLNTLANALPLNGRTTAQISDQFTANVFVPAGYVFSIWSLIYLGLVAFVAYALTPAGRGSPAVRRIGGWFALSNIANGLWIVLWHYGVFPATLAVMLILLISLGAIAARLGAPRRAPSTADRWLVYLPFSVYLGWISVATIANAAIFLLDRGWDGAPFSPSSWACLLLAIASGLGAWMVVRRGDLAYAAVLVWAFIGIAVKQAAVAPVPAVAWAGVAFLTILAAWRIARGLTSRPSAPPRPLRS
jgi:hypothetical protein